MINFVHIIIQLDFISGCEFSYSGVDNFDSDIKAVYNSPNGINNTITVVDCTYDNKVIAY